MTEGARILREAGIPDERLTAGVLLGHVLAWDRVHLLTRAGEQIDESAYSTFLDLIARRARGEPLQYLTGHQEFYGLDFKVTPAVLIPRPETEFLVERIIEIGSNWGSPGGPLIVDIGTGSGCIAISLAVNLPRAEIIATDISGEALEVARLNAEHYHVSPRIEFIEGDLFVAIEGKGLEGSVDVVACNPPYVPAAHPETIQREVRDWEPPVALFGGEQGLDFYRRLLADAPAYVRPGGFLVCEIGYNQLAQIRSMIEPGAWDEVTTTSDLQGVPRILTIRRAIAKTQTPSVTRTVS
jgi:release factor glutamine methyltransferase